MRTCFFLTFVLLNGVAALGQTSPATTTPTRSVTTAPPAKPVAPTRQLSPAEERQRQKQAAWLEKERQFRVMWAAKQRARAERDREKAAQRAEKEAARQRKKTNVAPSQPAVVSTGADPARLPGVTPARKQPAVGTAPAEPTSQADRTAQRDREKAAQRAEKDQKAQADAAVRAQRDQQRTAETQRRKAADAATRTARRAEQQTRRPASETTRAQPADRPSQPANAPVTAPEPAARVKPVAVPRRVRPERVRVERARPDGPPLAPELQPDTLASRMPIRTFLPKGHLFEPIMLDPIQSQASVSVLPVFWTDGEKYKGSIVPFVFGFDKPFLRRYRDRNRTEELGLDVASFTQFEVYYDDLDKVSRRRIINTDYRVSILYNVRRYDHVWRFRLYHLSSHLGDDYIYRNQLTFATNNPVNYEVVDATYSKQINGLRVYGGLGFGLRRWAERKPLSGQAGLYYKKTIRPGMRMVAGVDAKVWQQTRFRPGVKAGWGVELGSPANYLTFVLEGYSGFRPYSQFEDQNVTWFGISTYLNPF